MNFTYHVSLWVVIQLLILPVALPMLVGLVSTRVTSSRAKSILLLALSIVSSIITQVVNAYNSGNVDFDLGMALLTGAITFVMGVGVHYGLLKPTGTTDALLDTGRTADGFGEVN